MKALIKSLCLPIIILAAAGFHSCERKNPDSPASGSLELFISQAVDESALKSVVPDSNDVASYYALLTVIGTDSVPVLEDEQLPLYKFGDGFFSEKIELKAGYFQLVKFMIIDPAGEVIFAAPLEGSPKAYLVKDPLPVGFKIRPGETTRLSPEVLPVDGSSPSEFGYSSFGFSVVKPLPFYIGVMIDDPMIMAPVLYTDACLSVYHPDGWHHDFYLQEKVNRVVIRGGADYYTLVVEKEGYKPQKFEISAKELLGTSGEQPLIVRLGPSQMLLVLQPGPEDGIDAMISDLDPEKNFGEHPYFEATFISEPVLTVMRENRSLIRFDRNEIPKSARIEKVILVLYYDVPVPWDSILPTDTLVYNGFNWYGGVLQQVVDPWEENGVTWNNQPKTTESNQVYITPFIRNANFIELDITRLFVHAEISAPYYGMMFKLSPEPMFPGFRFASSDYKEPAMRPKLKIYYTIPVD